MYITCFTGVIIITITIIGAYRNAVIRALRQFLYVINIVAKLNSNMNMKGCMQLSTCTYISQSEPNQFSFQS